MTRIQPRDRVAMVRAFENFEGPDRARYNEVLSWHPEDPGEEVPGVPVVWDPGEERYFFTSGGRDWMLVAEAPVLRFPPVPGQ